MSMNILSKARGYNNSLFYTTELRKMLEDHIPYIKAHPSTVRKTLTLAEAERYKWDISSYFSTIVDPDLVWFTMRLNGYLKDEDYDGTELTMLVAGNAVIEDLLQRYLFQLGS